MKIYGYSKDSDELQTLTEVILQTSPSNIRQLAKFLLKTADLMDQHGEDFGHQHLQDNIANWPRDNPDIIIMKENST